MFESHDFRKCLYGCVRVCVYRFISIDFNRTGLIFYFIFFDFFYFYFLIRKLFPIFDLRKIYFCVFLMIGLRYLDRTNTSLKNIKIPIFLKKYFYISYYGPFVFNKNVFS